MNNFERIKQELRVEAYIAIFTAMNSKKYEPCEACKEYHKEGYDSCKPFGNCKEEARSWLNAEESK